MSRINPPNGSPAHNTFARQFARKSLSLVGAFFIVAILGFAISWMSTDTAAAAASTVTDLRGTPGDAYPRLKPETEEQLQAAFSPQVGDATKAFRDAFSDRTNVSGVAQPAQAVATSAKLPTSVQATVEAPGLPEFSARLAARNQSLRNGHPGQPISSIYSYTELRPIGVVGGGEIRDALLYAEPSKQTFAARLGSRFYDATLIAITEEGVKFKTQQGVRAINWTRVTNTSGRTPISAHPTAETPSLPSANPTKTGVGSPSPSLQDAVSARYSAHRRPADVPANQSLNAEVVKLSVPVGLTVPEAPSVSTATSATPIRYHHISLAPSKNNFELDSNGGEQDPAQPTPAATPEKQTPETQASTSSSAAETNTTASKPVAQQPLPQEPEAKLQFCDANFKSQVYTMETVGTTTLGVLLNDLHYRYNINFMPDADVIDLPAPLTVTEAPWGEVLRTILDYNDLDAVCTSSGIIRIAKRTKIIQIRDARRKSEPVYTKLYTLRYLQPTSGGAVDLAGRVQATKTGTVESLENAIREIMRASGDPRAEVRRVPGRNEFFISGTQQQHDDISRLITQADRPPVQVYLQATVYTVNDNQSLRLGTEFSALVGNSNGTRFGGISTLPSTTSGTTQGGTTGSGTGTGQQQTTTLVPGGVANLTGGFVQPSGALAAASPLFSAGVTSIFGTFQFAAQFTAAKQKGLLFERYSPVGVVADGEAFNLDSGTQFPIIIPALVTGGTGTANTNGNVVFVQAGRIASIVPQVALAPDGTPDFVTLQLRLENNSVDTSLAGLGTTAPPVNRQSIQTVVRLKDKQTLVVGGFALDNDSDTRQQVPGLGSIPGLGHLFKSKSKQQVRAKLYYAISVTVIPQDSSTSPIELPADVKERESKLQKKTN